MTTSVNTAGLGAFGEGHKGHDRRDGARRRAGLQQRETDLARLLGLRRTTQMVLTGVCVLVAIFMLAPVAWIVINATKTQANIYESFGFWFAKPFELLRNLKFLDEDIGDSGTYVSWLSNTALYAFLGGAGATVFSALAGYGFSRYRFKGRGVLFGVAMSALLIPVTAITLPLYLVYAKAHLINSIWGMILPSMVSPFGVFLMRTFTDSSVPRELIDAARVDGASEKRIFVLVGVPLMVPGLVTVFLLSVVGIWNNYVLPLFIFSKNSLYPVTVGLATLAGEGPGSGIPNTYPLLVMGGLVTIIPLLILFVVLQRYWRGGALLGSLTG